MRGKLCVIPFAVVVLAALACNSGLPAGTVLFKAVAARRRCRWMANRWLPPMMAH